MPIAYDTSTDALFRPELRPTLFHAGIDPNPLQLAIEAARLAYYRFEESASELERLNAALAAVGFGSAVRFRGDPLIGSEGFGAFRTSDTTALLAFRGTQPDKLADLGTNAATLRAWSPWGVGKVHVGFMRAYAAIHQDIVDWLNGSVKDRSRLILCGHSLGAALACLCASVATGPRQVVTLGGPRTGDAQFVNSLAGVPWTRLVDCCDVVTRLPPELLHYRHPTFRTYITWDGAIRENPTDAFVAADREAGRIEYMKNIDLRPGTVLVRDLADHAPVNYARSFF